MIKKYINTIINIVLWLKISLEFACSLDIRRTIVDVLLWSDGMKNGILIGNCNQKGVAVRRCRYACVRFKWSHKILCEGEFSFLYLLYLCESESHCVTQGGWHSTWNSPAFTSLVLGLEVYTITSDISSISLGNMTETNAKLTLCLIIL